MRRSVSVVLTVALAMVGMATMTAARAGAPAPSIVEPALAAKLRVAKPTEQLTVFVRGTDLATARRVVASAGLEKVTEWASIDVVVGVGTPSAVRAATKASGVEYVEIDKPLVYFLNTAHQATRGDLARTLPQLQQPTGGAYDGAGVTIGVTDSGVDGSHEMFVEGGQSKVRLNLRELCHEAICGGVTINMAKTPVNDSDTVGAGGHGTHVAGIAAGYARTTANGRSVSGAAPGAMVAAYGMGAGLSILAPNTALQFMLDNRNNPCLDGSCPPLKVVNNSWGTNGEFNPNSATSLLSNALVDAGVTVVFAAGNGDALNDGGDGSDNRVNPYAQNPKPGVIGVANYDDLETGSSNGQLDSSSSRGERGRPETYPDLAAPGSLIVSACRAYQPICRSYGNTEDVTDPNYASIGGTSMAAPYIAGVVALLEQANPALTPADIEDLLEDTAYKFGDPGSYEADLPARNNDNTTSFDKGHGLVDVTAALGEARNVTVPAPPPPPPPPTTEAKAYTGAYGDAAVNCALGLGGVCFDINNVKPGATITIDDDNAQWPVAALYQFRDASDTTVLEGFMCGQVSSPVPATATRLLLFISEATGPVNCFLADGSVGPGAATTGTVTVDWVPVPPPNPQTKKYSVPSGDAVANCDGVGGACFDRQNAAGSVSVSFDDDRSAEAVGAGYRFIDAAGATITGATGNICGSATLAVPANAAGIRFFMRTVLPPPGCTGRATTGSITVNWT